MRGHLISAIGPHKFQFGGSELSEDGTLEVHTVPVATQ